MSNIETYEIYAIKYSGFPIILEEYNDVNNVNYWIFDSDETKFTSGYVFTFGSNVIR